MGKLDRKKMYLPTESETLRAVHEIYLQQIDQYMSRGLPMENVSITSNHNP